MKRFVPVFGALGLLLLLFEVASVLAWQPSSKGQDAKRIRVRKLLEVTEAGERAKKTMDELFDQYRKDPDLAEFADLYKEVDTQQLVELIVPIYMKHYSEEEINGLIEFYKTPVGRKLIQTQPKIMKETMEVYGKWWEERILSSLEDEKADK